MKFKSFINRVFIFILICISIFVFYLGWEQLELEENTYGLVFTKTSGWKEEVLDKGIFSWSLEKIIPTNYKIHKFTIKKELLNIATTSTLPSGKLYADFAQISDENFIYSYTANTYIKFNKDYLISFANKGYFTEETFTQWKVDKIKTIKESLKSYINNKIILGELHTLNSEVLNYISGLFPYFYFEDIIINLNNIDIQLYSTVRNRYINYIETQKEAEKKYLKKSLEQQNLQKVKLDLLKMYGEVFTQYPIMIEYIKADKDMLLDRARLDDFIKIQTQN